MLLSLRNPSPALGVELNTLLLQGVQTMDRYPRPLLPQSHPSPTPVTLPSFPTSRLLIPPVLIWACHFTSRVSRSLISCWRLFLWAIARLSVVITVVAVVVAVVIVIRGQCWSCCAHNLVYYLFITLSFHLWTCFMWFLFMMKRLLYNVDWLIYVCKEKVTCCFLDLSLLHRQIIF